MDWLAALLGLVQGLTEFLPVSSSGHLVIAETLLGRADEGIVFEVAVHVGTLLAILVYWQFGDFLLEGQPTPDGFPPRRPRVPVHKVGTPILSPSSRPPQLRRPVPTPRP